MKFRKNMKIGVSIIFLLLIFTTSISLIDFSTKNELFDENSLSISASEDFYEPNNFITFAFDISNNKSVWLSSINGLGTQADDDYFKIYVNFGGDQIKINLNYAHNTSENIDVELLDSTGSYLAGSYFMTGVENINFIAPFGGDYYIRVFGDNATNQYDLWWETDDQYEENDDWVSAYDISLNEFSSHNGIQADDDWFRTWVDPGELRLHVDVYHDQSKGNIDFEIYYFNGFDLDWIAWTNDTCIDMNVPWSGEYYIYIYGDDTGNNYDLRWEDALPYDDSYEENDYDGEAYDLTSYEAWWLSWINGSGIQSDEDWYMVYLDPGEERIHVELTFDHSKGDIDLEVYYYDGTTLTLLDWSSDVYNYEYIDANAPWPGTYYIRVYYGDKGNEYDLFWEDLIPGVSADDWMEENDDFWNAKWVDPNYYSGLKIVGYDEDWFHFYLIDGDKIDVDIFFHHLDGDLELELYDPSNIQRIGSYSSDDDEYISFIADMLGDWRIRVYHLYGDTDVYYDLDIWLNKGSIVDDPYEENDFDFQAYDITSYQGWWLRDIGGVGRQFDEDWYEIYVEPGFEYLIVNFVFNYNAGDIHFDVYDADLNVMTKINSRDNYESFIFNLPSSGNYYIKVYGSNKGVNYDLKYFTIFILEEQTWISDLHGLGVQGDFDFYLIDVSPGFLHVEVDLLFNNTLGNMSMILYSETGTNMTDSYSKDGNEYIDYFLPYPGKFFLLIHGNNMGNEYDLWWDDVKTDLRPDDAYEHGYNNNTTNNNDPSSAYDLSNDQHRSLWEINGLALQFDEDWYKISVETGFERLIVEVKYDIAEGMVGFEIYDVNLTKITGNFSMVDDAFIDYVLPNEGVFYVRVFGDNTGNVYNLRWQASEDFPLDQIPGYNTLILIISFVGVTAVVIKIKRSKFKHQ